MICMRSYWKPQGLRVRPWPRRNPLSLLGASLGAVSLLGVIAFGLWVLLGPVLGGVSSWELGTEGMTRYSLARMVLYIVAGTVGVIGVVVAYRRQHIEEGHFLERLSEAARQLGEQNPTVQAAGIYALAALADASPQHRRQQCLDVLCAYLRLPYTPQPHPGEYDGSGMVEKIVRTRTMRTTTGETEEEQTLILRPHDRQTRQTIIGVMAQHLRPEAAVSWSRLDFDFSHVVFDGGDFRDTRFAGKVSFREARFLHGATTFSGSRFMGTSLVFTGARFLGGTVSFTDTQFSGRRVDFTQAAFLAGPIDFSRAVFAAEHVDFTDATVQGASVKFRNTHFTHKTVAFTGIQVPAGELIFRGATFSGAVVRFDEAHFSGGRVDFDAARFTAKNLTFSSARFAGSDVQFDAAQFADGEIYFRHAWLTAGELTFYRAHFSGARVDFTAVNFQGATVDFHRPASWSHPPMFSSNDPLPAGILPREWPPRPLE